jgi:hypothetical protein
LNVASFDLFEWFDHQDGTDPIALRLPSDTTIVSIVMVIRWRRVHRRLIQRESV